jgi:hypothetical protein
MAKFQFEEPDFDGPTAQGGIVEYRPVEPAPTTPTAAVLRKHESRLLALPGVKGVGVGSGPAGADCIEVFLAHQGDAKRLPRELDGVCVTTTVVGEVDAYGLR